MPSASLCTSCVHLHARLNEWDMQTFCTAYPDGIPVRYLAMGEPHIKADGHDGGVIYKLDPRRQHLLEIYLEQHDDVEIPEQLR